MASVDNFWAMISYFGLALFFVAMLLAWNGITNIDNFWDANPTATTAQTNAQNAVNQFDFIGVIVYVGLHLGILAAAYLLRTHPVILVAAILLTAILTLVAAPISNAWEDISTDNELTGATITTSIPKVNFIMLNLPLFEVVWALATIIVMFGFARSEGYV